MRVRETSCDRGWRSSGASLQPGQGRWQGSLAVRYQDGRLSGNSDGSISDVRIEEMLRAFTAAKDPLSGMAKATAVEKAKGLLDSFLKKRTETPSK